MKNILIRCDASKEIGLGHVIRCLTLANKFKQLKYNIVFAMKNYEIGIEKVLKEKFKIDIASEEFDYFKWIKSCVKKYKVDIFIGDVRDGLSLEIIQSLKKQSILTIAIDEPSAYAKECDLCFYPPHAIIDKNDYKGIVYQGWEYVILKDTFYKKSTKIINNIPNVLIMMGGTDTKNLTLKVIKELEVKKDKFNIVCLLNKKNSMYGNLVSFSRTSNKNIKIYSSINDMSKFLDNIDFGIITFGVSAYELLYKNIPSIHICLDEDHIKASSFFNQNNYAKSITVENITIEKDFLKNRILSFNRVKSQILNKIQEG